MSVGSLFGNSCSRFELPNRCRTECHIPVQIVRIENRFHIPKCVTSNRGDFRFGASRYG